MENLYKAPVPELHGETTQDQYIYGGFWIRFLVSIIDSILIMTFSLD